MKMPMRVHLMFGVKFLEMNSLTMKTIHITETTNHANARDVPDRLPACPNESTFDDMNVLELCSISGNVATSACVVVE
jgi:hypothetical protein